MLRSPWIEVVLPDSESFYFNVEKAGFDFKSAIFDLKSVHFGLQRVILLLSATLRR